MLVAVRLGKLTNRLLHDRGGVARQGKVPLHTSGLVLRRAATPIDDALHGGEVVGPAGLEGHGQDAFIKSLWARGGDPYLFQGLIAVIVAARHSWATAALHPYCACALTLIKLTTILVGLGYDLPTQQMVFGALILFVVAGVRTAAAAARPCLRSPASAGSWSVQAPEWP